MNESDSLLMTDAFELWYLWGVLPFLIAFVFLLFFYFISEKRKPLTQIGHLLYIGILALSIFFLTTSVFLNLKTFNWLNPTHQISPWDVILSILIFLGGMVINVNVGSRFILVHSDTGSYTSRIINKRDSKCAVYLTYLAMAYVVFNLLCVLYFAKFHQFKSQMDDLVLYSLESRLLTAAMILFSFFNFKGCLLVVLKMDDFSGNKNRTTRLT